MVALLRRSAGRARRRPARAPRRPARAPRTTRTTRTARTAATRGDTHDADAGATQDTHDADAGATQDTHDGGDTHDTAPPAPPDVDDDTERGPTGLTRPPRPRRPEEPEGDRSNGHGGVATASEPPAGGSTPAGLDRRQVRRLVVTALVMVLLGAVAGFGASLLWPTEYAGRASVLSSSARSSRPGSCARTAT